MKSRCRLLTSVVLGLALSWLPWAEALGGEVVQATVSPEVIRFPVVESGGLEFRRMSTADGLSQTRVAQIVQDDQGFMWFGTQYGLNRYDGYEYKLFVHDPQRSNTVCAALTCIPCSRTRAGMLWIGCNQLVDRFDPRTEVFTPLPGRAGPSRQSKHDGGSYLAGS